MGEGGGRGKKMYDDYSVKSFENVRICNTNCVFVCITGGVWFGRASHYSERERESERESVCERERGIKTLLTQ